MRAKYERDLGILMNFTSILQEIPMTQMAGAIFPREYREEEGAPYNHFPYSLASEARARLGNLITI
ncbi:hypothetical protein [Ekhidna sp.]|uniref:hypothetical protein n=1 Tax=Ekhidna sp. TaxID=2608089 RepID=UPI003CCBAA2F